ncbi:MAG TPA: HAMP domain-containing sensor histidine kinase, partial [Herpetosiphonaceae bacterium]
GGPPANGQQGAERVEVSIGEDIYALSVAELRDPAGNGGQVVVLQDITHFKELDALKSRFVSTVSHDLKSPLTAIQGYAQLVADGHLGPISDPQRDALQAVIRNSASMTMLISDLLDLGKLEAGIGINPQLCDLSVLVREVVDEMQIRAKLQKLQLQQKLPVRLPLVADPARVRQVLANLVSNAIKYTPSGGQIHVVAYARNGNVNIAVKDSGLGIPDDALPHIFDRFYRVKRDSDSKVEGTGLGLAIVKSIIEEHGGQINVTSKVGAGSTFLVSLPANLPQSS